MPKYPWLELPLVALAFFSSVLIIWLRLGVKFKTTAKDGSTTEDSKGLGVRVIQLVGLLIVVPVVAILALECRLSGEGVGTILGAIVGYALGGITSPIPGRRNPRE